ncbi:hypothetical protein EG346_11195 [Chryseobacterium carnipullorum]|uniref:Uncharacterized protein n=1 Tax=Chryseobacterium carnipullorum TaxID=1124835 RepID=A0A1M7KP83_CHRCU|nr:hypothetical protein [Chryseobacterium carnipullorum]MDN5396829.1 hypothetical protein [Chryseobacterium sp.]AZA48708.1 hypothetical protein EG346_11195 [Chryseobacterium carnipullorum]AZA63621.1 hypothetical protein EG345_02095 [Chryseobacterium carnipullorum]MDN5423920.1 hypothetical protein [Chryseobacterium sp.]MDN5477474.1 hypothetical protein [Chryseobacterium sp.]
MNENDYKIAVAEWSKCLSDYHLISNLIPTNYIFELPADKIEKIKEKNKYVDVCAEVGVFNGEVVLIFIPLDEKGYVDKSVVEYQYTVLAPLKHDIILQQSKEFTVVKNAVLSSNLTQIDDNTNTFFPVSDQPILDQDIAIEAIGRWRDEGMEWFFRECTEFAGARIFRKFYIPMEDLCHPEPKIAGVKCSFALRYNDIYGRMLVTLIFISFQELLQGNSAKTISNTYDWAKPCPPICRIPELGS